MYLNTVTVLRTFLACCIMFKDVFSNRLASPQRLFSEEPDIFDRGSYYLSQSDHRRFSRSIDERQGIHERIRRSADGSSPPPRPKITGPAPLCSHDELYIRWTDTNLVSEKGAIFALCRPNPSRSITSVIYVSYDYGISWINLTSKFSSILKKKPSVNMYYFVPNAPEFIVFADTLNKRIFYTNDEGRNLGISQHTSPFSPQFAPESVYINPEKHSMVLASEKVTSPNGKDIYKLHISKNGAKSFNHLQLFVDVKAFYWGSKKYGDKSTDLFLEAKTNAHGLQGYQLDCSNTSETSTCTLVKILTNGAPINGEITDFLVKGDYMFVTQHNEAKTGLYLYVKYKRTGKFVKANIVTPTPIKEAFVYDVSDGQVMLVCNLRKNETNLYISYDATGGNYSLSLPRVLYHNPNSEVSSHWLRRAVRYRFVDILRAKGLKFVYFATQLTVGPVGGRYLISKMTFDKGGVWQRIKGPDRNKYNRPCYYPSCSLHINLLYGSIYRYSKTTPLLSRESSPGLLMATGVLGTNLKITPDTYLSRDGGKTFQKVLNRKRRFGFGDYGGIVLASHFGRAKFLEYSTDFKSFYQVQLPNASRPVDIKKILTEPGDRATVFLVITLENSQYSVYTVNTSKTLGELPCTDKDFHALTVGDLGIGKCETHVVRLRNASSRCITGKSLKKVVSISYSKCACERAHYRCDYRFEPDDQGSCIQMPQTSLVPSHCPEGSNYQRSRGYVMIPQFASCLKGNHTLAYYEPYSAPCPVRILRLKKIKTFPEANKYGIVKVRVHGNLTAKAVLVRAYLDHVKFTYVFDDYNTTGIGSDFAHFKHNPPKPGSFILRILLSNTKSFITDIVSVNVIRPLTTSIFIMNVLPKEPSIFELTTFDVKVAKDILSSEYGFPLNYVWKVITFVPSKKTILEASTPVSSYSTSFNRTGTWQINVSISNGIDRIVLTKWVKVTADLKPKNIKLLFNDPILTVKWDVVRGPNVIGYRIFYRKQGENTYLEESSCGSTITDTKCDIRNIEYYTKYFVKVDTALTTEPGPESDVKYIIIPPGKASPPSKVRLINDGHAQLRASWETPIHPNGIILNYKYMFYKSTGGPPEEKNVTGQTITFTQLEALATYIFKVAAVNTVGVGTYSQPKVAVAVVEKPTLPPTSFRLIGKTSSSATLTWKAPLLKKDSKFSLAPKSYNIYMKKDGKFTRVYTSSFNEFKLKQLKPNTFYEIAVSAVVVSEGPKGYFNFTTKVGVPQPPANLKAVNISSRQATLTWSPSVINNVNIQYYVYQVQPYRNRSRWLSKKTQFNVLGLRPCTSYLFAVSAWNIYGNSERSHHVLVTTGEAVPDRPAEVEVALQWPASSSVNVSWIPPLNPHCEIKKYRVRWVPMSGLQNSEDEKEPPYVDVDAQTFLVHINHLKENTKYTINVQASTKAGWGMPHTDELKTQFYPFGSQRVHIQFESPSNVNELKEDKEFKKSFINTIAKIGDISDVRIADVRFDVEENAVVFELISKKELHASSASEISTEMEAILVKLKKSFMVGSAKTKANSVTSISVQTAKSSLTTKSSSNSVLIVGIVFAIIILLLIGIVLYVVFRHRRKGLYNKFDNNFKYNHEDESIAYESPEVEVASGQKRRHKNIESVPLADADELT